MGETKANRTRIGDPWPVTQVPIVERIKTFCVHCRRCVWIGSRNTPATPETVRTLMPAGPGCHLCRFSAVVATMEHYEYDQNGLALVRTSKLSSMHVVVVRSLRDAFIPLVWINLDIPGGTKFEKQGWWGPDIEVQIALSVAAGEYFASDIEYQIRDLCFTTGGMDKEQRSEVRDMLLVHMASRQRSNVELMAQNIKDIASYSSGAKT